MSPSKKTSTRDQLLAASLKAFGSKDYDAVSTREIVEAAEANISAISYHFGGKQPLYLATAEYLAHALQQEIGPTLQQIEQQLSAEQPADYRQLIQQLITAFVKEMVEGELSTDAAGFIFREQLKPTQAFDILYQGRMGPLHGLDAALLSRLLQCPASDRKIKLMTHALLGQIIIFRVGQTTILRRLQSDQFTSEDCQQITRIITQQTLAAIDAQLQQDPTHD